jgi:hypothetical protein
MIEIKEIVKKVMEDLGSKKLSLDHKKINLSLEKVLSPKELKHIWLHSFKKKILRINTDSSVLLYQLNLKKDLILKRLQEDFGPDFIEEIIFHLGNLSTNK